jgi:folate-binding protein YgfZ
MSIEAEVRAIRQSAAVARRPDVRTLELTGPDRGRFLNSMLTRDVSRLSPSQGAMAIKTNNRGRIEAVLRVRALEGAFQLDVLEAVATKLEKTLAGYIIMDDCAIADVSAGREVVSVLGPKAGEVLGAPLPQLVEHGFVREPNGRTIVRDAMLGLDGFEIHLPAGGAVGFIGEIVARGAVPVSLEALDVARVEAGVAIDGRDLDDTIPMEARLERALDFDKGCYVGQEVIARAHNLGGVKHILVGIVLEGDRVPEKDAPILLMDGRTRTGEVTSAVYSPTLDRVIALGYVKRAQESPGAEILVAPSSGSSPAPEIRGRIVDLPFVR